MKKYFIKNESGQEGPYSPEELLEKGAGPDTPVWYEGLESWTTAGQVEEIRSLFPASEVTAAPNETAVPVQEAVNPEPAPVDPAPATTVQETSPAAAPPPVTPAPAAAGAPLPVRKKGNAVISWVLSLAVLGGAGFYVYQDIEKNKDNVSPVSMTGESADLEIKGGETDNNGTVTDTKTETDSLPALDTSAIIPVTTEPATTEKEKVDPKLADDEKQKQAALIAAKKKEEDKKKKAAAEAKKKEEERKKQLAAEALAAKEMEMRNKWAKYVTMGSFQIEGDDKVKPFEIPVYNGYAYPLEKVTLRVDYLKKEKIVATETLTLSNIPAKGSLRANATGNKKGKTANVYITGASSRGLHFCYPSTGGKNGDPYYCN